MNNIILFDGECNFCDKSVTFVINKDPKAHFKFASLQSDIGKELLKKYSIPTDTDSFVLIQNEKAYIKSSAGLRVCKQLKGVWKILYVFLIIPKPIRNAIYDVIAKNRYKWFGKKETCMIPTPEIRSRFLS